MITSSGFAVCATLHLKHGMKSACDEWQVVDGRRIVSRHDTEKQAEEWAAQNPKASLGKSGAAPAAMSMPAMTQPD